MERLDEVAVIVGREIGKTGVSNNLICTWITHGVLTMPEKQMVKLIVAGKASAESDIKSGNPGTNGHKSGVKIVVDPLDRERIVPAKYGSGAIDRGSRKRTQGCGHDEHSAAAH